MLRRAHLGGVRGRPATDRRATRNGRRLADRPRLPPRSAMNGLVARPRPGRAGVRPLPGVALDHAPGFS